MSEPRWIRGIDEPLPPGEEVLWSGGPDARATARHVFHIRVWGAYLTGLVVLVGTSAFGRLPWQDALKVTLLPLLITALVVTAVAAFARATARQSAYVITSKRVVLRVGVAFPIAINIPLRLIDDAGLRVFRDGSGEIRLTLPREMRLAYIALWPHVETLRHFASPRPKLRGLSAPGDVGRILSAAIAADAAVEPVTVRTAEASADVQPSFVGAREAFAR